MFKDYAGLSNRSTLYPYSSVCSTFKFGVVRHGLESHFERFIYRNTGAWVSENVSPWLPRYYYFSCHPTMCSMVFNVDHSYLSRKKKTSETKVLKRSG